MKIQQGLEGWKNAASVNTLTNRKAARNGCLGAFRTGTVMPHPASISLPSSPVSSPPPSPRGSAESPPRISYASSSSSALQEETKEKDKGV